MENTDRTKLVSWAEIILSEEFQEPVIFNGFVEVSDLLQIKFVFTNENTQYLPFNSTWEDIEHLINNFKIGSKISPPEPL
jgi:hypothetical protein